LRHGNSDWNQKNLFTGWVDVDLSDQGRAEAKRVDELHRSVFDVVLGDSWKENAMFTVDVTLASRYHERFADHVVDISSKVSYLTTGDWSDEDLNA